MERIPMPKEKRSQWFEETKLGGGCDWETHCKDCDPSGNCDICGTIDGRFMEVVNEYASTCDGDCMEIHSHELLAMDTVTQLGYCEDCIPKLPVEIQKRLERKFESQIYGIDPDEFKLLV
jgi:hypothetical protein